MFTRVRLFFIFVLIFFISSILYFIFVSGFFRSDLGESRVLVGGVNGSEVVEFLSDFGVAAEGARVDGKPIIVFFTLSGNENCERSFELFRNKEIQRLSKHFICVVVDGVSSDSVCELYKVSAFPTVLILDTEGKEIQRLTGKETKEEQLTIQMHIAIQLATNANKSKIR
ncbi:MAG: thioredoxin family protein [Planctomycetaceae bacterium]|jgi:thioredoxin-related protein|nr:thioredoxin family protein [Planctomycetaceae bacterium]